MRTTLDIDPKLIDEVEKLTGEKSASKAINKVLAEYVRKEKLSALRDFIGKSELVDDLRERKDLELADMKAKQQ